MDNVLSINHTKENVVDFEITTEGVETKDITVCLVVKAKGMDLCFEAKKKKGDEWSVKIPKLPMLDRTTYNYHIQVQSDGYHFEPLKGKFNVVGSAEVYSTAPKNTTLDPDDKKETTKKKAAAKKAVKETSQPWRAGEKPIEQLARELMEKQDFTPAEVDKKVQEAKDAVAEMPAGGNKDDKIRSILEEVGIKPKAPRKKAKLSLGDVFQH